MKLRQLDIAYFRCFKQYHIDFASEITVLIGKNGAGKSTLINSVHKALSFIFKKNTAKKNDRTLSSGIPSLKVELFDKNRDLERDPKTGLAYPHISIKAIGDFYEQTLEWEIYASTSTFNIQHSKYTKAFNKFIDIFDKEDVLPVLAFYSDSFPHVESKSTKESRTLMSLRNFGYFQWNEESACSSVWIDKYEKIWKEWDRYDRKIKDWEQSLENSINNKQKYSDDLKEKIESGIKERDKLAIEVNAIKDCLKKFTENDPVIEIQDLFLDVYDEKLCLETTKGDNPPFRKLPAGYKRLLYIVLDIAYRSYKLNGTTQSSGIVVIDEIDLHLHPSLEQSILQRLHDTFPHIQFIVSTHSALVIANLDTTIQENGNQANKVYMMEIDTEEPILLPNLYGVDYNATMRDFMETPARNENIKRLTDEFFSFKALNMEKEADSTYEKIKQVIGDDNNVVLQQIDERLKQL